MPPVTLGLARVNPVPPTRTSYDEGTDEETGHDHPPGGEATVVFRGEEEGEEENQRLKVMTTTSSNQESRATRAVSYIAGGIAFVSILYVCQAQGAPASGVFALTLVGAAHLMQQPNYFALCVFWASLMAGWAAQLGCLVHDCSGAAPAPAAPAPTTLAPSCQTTTSTPTAGQVTPSPTPQSSSNSTL